MNGRCGDSVLQAAHEQCDATQLNGTTCQDLGYLLGELRCDSSCQFDTTYCQQPIHCGDGDVDENEDCDGEDLDGASCHSLGYYGGILTCDDCAFDVSACEPYGWCGDSTLQAGHELCDGSETDGVTCIDVGFYGGTLACNNSCDGYDTSGCAAHGWCGDGTIQGGEEACDGSNLGTTSCTSLGYYGGTLSCDASCQLDVSDCATYGWCGDGVIDGTHGEVCDGTNIDPNHCATLGYYDGTPICTVDCEIDISSCESEGRCGDGVIQDEETCDGEITFSCTALGFYARLLPDRPGRLRGAPPLRRRYHPGRLWRGVRHQHV